jgi:glycosyltransferase involved in cell wall biosynthesis
MVQRFPDDEFQLFVDTRAAASCDITAPNARCVVVKQRVSPTVAAAADGARAIDDMLRMGHAVWRAKADVFFSPSVYTYFPLPMGLSTVVTLHDAIAERYPDMTLPSRRARLFWQLKTRLALAQAHVVLTVSDYSADELVAVHGIPRTRIRVATEAPAAAYRPSESAGEIAEIAERFGLAPDDRWFVYVGGFNPHKHVDVIVRAHARIAAESASPPHLLLVGTRSADVFHGSGAVIDEAIRDSGTEHLVHWTGFVADDELRHLLSGALALVLPSQSEGFGLPAVEAAACGTPVIATTESPLPQLLEGGGYFVGPGDQPGLAEAMRALLANECDRLRMGACGRARAAALSWSSAADAAMSALREAAA